MQILRLLTVRQNVERVQLIQNVGSRGTPSLHLFGMITGKCLLEAFFYPCPPLFSIFLCLRKNFLPCAVSLQRSSTRWLGLVPVFKGSSLSPLLVEVVGYSMLLIIIYSTSCCTKVLSIYCVFVYVLYIFTFIYIFCINDILYQWMT